MKKLIILSCLSMSLSLISQDLSEKKYFSKLKNVKHYSIDNTAFLCILNNNTYLNALYNKVEGGEYNSTYTFIKVSELEEFQNTKEENFKFVNLNISFWLNTLGIDLNSSAKVKKEILKSKSLFENKSSVLINLDVLEKYDECTFLFENKDNCKVSQRY